MSTGELTTQLPSDALNRLTSTVTGNTTTSSTYNGDGMLVGTTQGGATPQYVQDLATSLPQILQSTTGTTNITYLYGRERLTAVQGGVKTWFGTDVLGSGRQVLSNGGVPLKAINYDPWGQVEGTTQPGSFGFTGELQDVTTGLVNLRARWYQPNSGKFVGRDPFTGLLTLPQTAVPYTYVENTPVNKVDPSGNLAVFVGGLGSDTYVQDPFNPQHMVSVWEMGRRFAGKGIIPGKTFIAPWNNALGIEQLVRSVSSSTCSVEPIILVGHSLGAQTIMNVALDLPSVKIDLMITEDIVNLSADVQMAKKPASVVRQLNFTSGNSPLNVAEKAFLLVPEYVDGAENWLVDGAIHTTLDNEFFDSTKTRPNPVWSISESAIRSIH
ncbi:MAG: RHS repeat-associated core domain-containing protein [Herpetosiphonaceae bacterium]|nr:RHS repeat-associated core domain-containing protein [Herpetosiphonaceae bacterium]